MKGGCMSVLSVISKINQTFNNSVHSDIHGEAKVAFSYGGCLVFCKILKKFYPNSKLLIDKKKGHCALLINEIGYDTSGKVNLNCFKVAEQEDIMYAENHYGFGLDSDDEIIQDILNLVNNQEKHII
jgi:hypothetical protein